MNKKRDGVPEDYPGRVVAFPDNTEHLMFAMYGVQSLSSATREQFVATLNRFLEELPGAIRIERCQFVDSAGCECDMLITYGLDRKAHDEWWGSEHVQDWWIGLIGSATPDTGYWREVACSSKERFNYAAGTEDRVASAAILPLAPSKTFGYWGAYRDRIPSSATDSFDSPYEETPSRRKNQTRGRVLRVRTPDNLCLIREGQAWERCGPEEKTVWDEQMSGVIDEWVDFLGSDPNATGCMTIRACKEIEVGSGKSQARQSQFAFLLSLAHIEHAARTQVSHLAVHSAFVKMYRKPTFKPEMHVWVEVHVLKENELETEYVNCHEDTGLLPYFDAEEVVR